MNIQTTRLVIRHVAMTDAVRMLEAMACPAIHQMYGFGFTRVDQVQGYIEALLGEYAAGKARTFAIAQKQNDALVGSITLDVVPMFSRVELSYWISQDNWNKGYATEAVRAMIAHSFVDLRLNRVQALISNPASERVLQKAGMTYEGTLKQYFGWDEHFWDVKMYAILRREFDAANQHELVAPPRPAE